MPDRTEELTKSRRLHTTITHHCDSKMTGGELQYADVGREADDGIKMLQPIQSSVPFCVSCERRSVLRPRHLFLQIYSAADTDGQILSDVVGEDFQFFFEVSFYLHAGGFQMKGNKM